MTHLHKATGMKVECGTLIEIGTNKTFDMTVITHWPGDDEPPVIIGYYFGDYDPEATDYYIDEWIASRNVDAVWASYLFDLHDIVDAYRITNEDVLEEPMSSKVERSLNILNETLKYVLGN